VDELIKAIENVRECRKQAMKFYRLTCNFAMNDLARRAAAQRWEAWDSELAFAERELVNAALELQEKGVLVGSTPENATAATA